MQLDFDLKRIKLEKAIKWGGGAIVLLLTGAVALALLESILAICVAVALGIVAVNVLPVMARRLSTWRIEQLRADAMRSPIPALIRQYEAEAARVSDARERVIRFNATTRSFDAKIRDYEQRNANPEGLEEMRRQYQGMLQALSVQTTNLGAQLDTLREFRTQIDSAQMAWQMALDIRSAADQTSEFTDVDPLERVLKHDALAAVRTKLNEGFAALETSLRVDYRVLPSGAAPAPVALVDLNAHLSRLNEVDLR